MHEDTHPDANLPDSPNDAPETENQPSLPLTTQPAENPVIGKSQENQQELLEPETPPGENAPESELEEDEEYEEEEVEEVIESEDGSAVSAEGTVKKTVKVRRRKRRAKADAAELRLQGRRALCKGIADIAPYMLKTVKLRVLGDYLESKRGLDDEALAQIIKKSVGKLADRSRILTAVTTPDPDFSRGQVKSIILTILLQEETYSLEENDLDTKVIGFEKNIVQQAGAPDFFDPKKHDPERWRNYDTYRIVLEAAWRNADMISPDEANLLRVLREKLTISLEDHWLIGAYIKRFPKDKCALHTRDEINDARKELQREGILWSYRDENNRNIDVVPAEIVPTIRRDVAEQELQQVNYRRLMSHDAILVTDLKNILQKRDMDKYGHKSELIERIVASNIKPSEILQDLDKEKLSSMSSYVGLRSSGNKADLIERLIDFYDDLTFEARESKDNREEWYNNYELLAARAYAELRAKKLITKDLEIDRMFEDATTFLFEACLHVTCDRSHKDSRADGRLPLGNHQCLLWDCKSAEGPVNLQDHLDGQFDGYLRKERDSGNQPLAFLVIAPSFTPQSIKLAHQYKARTNWDIALVTAEGLKLLAERWLATEPAKPFPIRLLNRTEVIDKGRAEFLLSLA